MSATIHLAKCNHCGAVMGVPQPGDVLADIPCRSGSCSADMPRLTLMRLVEACAKCHHELGDVAPEDHVCA